MIGRIGHIIRGAANAAKRWTYRKWATTCDIETGSVLLDQQHGRSADGSLHYIARELGDAGRYGNLSLHMAIDKGDAQRLEALLARRGVNAQPVIRSSRRYYRLLATSKHLVTDNSFPLAFAKREGQVLWNTWHGTPLKTLGRAEATEAHLIGNVQKNLAQADFLSFPNAYAAERIVGDYMIEGLTQATLLFGEYPRNEPLACPCDPDERARLIPRGTRAYAYLPTFRFSPEDGSKTAAIGAIARHLAEIDSALAEDEVMFAHLHPAIERSVPLDGFRRIKPVPDDYELYAFLNMCDALVTDYSSVMFDFEITRKKIVLFAFDQQRYLAERGLYRPLDGLPFPNVDNVADLMRELREPKRYDDRPIIAELNPYPAGHAAQRLCRRVFNGEAGLVAQHEIPAPATAPMLALAGELPCDGELESLGRRLEELAGESGAYLAFPCQAARDRVDALAALPQRVGFIPFSGRMALSPLEAAAILAHAAGIMSAKRISRIMSDALDFETRRIFGTARFSQVICLTDDWKTVGLAKRLQA